MELDTFERFKALEERVRQLEKHIHYPHNENAYVRGVDAMKEAAAGAEAFSKEQPLWKEYKPWQQPTGAHIHYPHNETAMKEAAAKAQARTIISEAYPPPMRADTEAILALTKFAKRLLNPEDLGHAVTFEVRQLARRALGLPEVKEYDL